MDKGFKKMLGIGLAAAMWAAALAGCGGGGQNGGADAPAAGGAGTQAAGGSQGSKLPLNSSISCRKSHVCSILTK